MRRVVYLTARSHMQKKPSSHQWAARKERGREAGHEAAVVANELLSCKAPFVSKAQSRPHKAMSCPLSDLSKRRCRHGRHVHPPASGREDASLESR